MKTVGEAAALVDQYDLTHNSGWGSACGAGGFRDSAKFCFLQEQSSLR